MSSHRSRARLRDRVSSRMSGLALLIAATVVLSSVQAITWPQHASATTAVDPGQVPPTPGLRTQPPASIPTAPAKQGANFSTLTTASGKAGSHFDAQRSKVVARTMFTTTYTNPDGTQSLQQSTAPLNVQDAAGAWQPVDTTLHPVAGTRSGTDRHPLSPSLAATANDRIDVKIVLRNGRTIRPIIGSYSLVSAIRGSDMQKRIADAIAVAKNSHQARIVGHEYQVRWRPDLHIPALAIFLVSLIGLNALIHIVRR